MLIYLNGTSSSGKTSIALELQKLIERPILYFSIDTILNSLPGRDLEAVKGGIAPRMPLNWEALFTGYFTSVAALVRAGNDVIADCPIYNEKLAGFFRETCAAQLDLTIVQLNCPVTILQKREQMRGDRALGLAGAQFPGIDKYLKPDLTVKTDIFTPESVARMILQKKNA